MENAVHCGTVFVLQNFFTQCLINYVALPIAGNRALGYIHSLCHVNVRSVFWSPKKSTEAAKLSAFVRFFGPKQLTYLADYSV